MMPVMRATLALAATGAAIFIFAEFFLCSNLLVFLRRECFVFCSRHLVSASTTMRFARFPAEVETGERYKPCPDDDRCRDDIFYARLHPPVNYLASLQAPGE